MDKYSKGKQDGIWRMTPIETTLEDAVSPQEINLKLNEEVPRSAG
jgi:hypothetical protein